MFFLQRRRLIVWLVRAYLKKWGKTILLCFVVGFLIIALLFASRNFLLSKIPLTHTTNIGIAGIYSKSDLPNNLPEIIQDQASRGLTKVDQKGNVLPDLADRWEVKDDGKTFIFYIKPNIHFSDGSLVDSKSINYNFSDVSIERPASSVIVFKLKDKYSPFPVTLANHKVFKKNYVGVSNYQITKAKINGGLIDYIQLFDRKNKNLTKYDFYDTQEALKNAYVLGEVDKIVDINNTDYSNHSDLADFKNSDTNKDINYGKIVTVFYNNLDPVLSDKKIRKALAYSLPAKFPEGIRAYTPYKKEYWFNNDDVTYPSDLEAAKVELKDSGSSSSGKLTINLKTLPQYEKLASDIAKDWKKAGVETKIETVETVPTIYQAFLGDLPILKDPDQYTLWHSGAPSNITNYKSLRIDKLLEDGRRISDKKQRKLIYDDFQKYLIDDMPASFLYFPYTYTVNRN